MKSTHLFLEAREVFDRGENVIAHFRNKGIAGQQMQDVILYSYDLQSGSYTQMFKDDPSLQALQKDLGDYVARILEDLDVKTVCEAGVGEATALKFIMESCRKPMRFSGFDISVNRLFYAQNFVKDLSVKCDFFSADLLRIPFDDNALDAIVTVHAMEPNGGSEEEILKELFRVARRYLILIEPDYALGDDTQKRRMETHNYIRDLPKHLAKLDGKLRFNQPLPFNCNPQNVASVLIFEKNNPVEISNTAYVSPISGKALRKIDNVLFCPEDGFAFPIINGIPCLQQRQAILASHLHLFAKN